FDHDRCAGRCRSDEDRSEEGRRQEDLQSDQDAQVPGQEGEGEARRREAGREEALIQASVLIFQDRSGPIGRSGFMVAEA
ncbi:hypothetical protein, partial [Mesorhizobium sp. M2E.F.Ca.ET.154.01.1.1]|uniref:hypothetical protein n=1 Tax=Mesorhizobium sp. M2E.F.Ca.ET.154.01.1.1 TaxID=2500521 RepID=UPI001675080F